MRTATINNLFHRKPHGRIGNRYIFQCWDDGCELHGVGIVESWKWNCLKLRAQIVTQMLDYGVSEPRKDGRLNFGHQIELGRHIGLS
jgi:hypothetical protein